MTQPAREGLAQHTPASVHAEPAWTAVIAAARSGRTVAAARAGGSFAVDPAGALRPVAADDPAAVLAWVPGSGWRAALPPDDPACHLLDLYLPVCSTEQIVVGHLGQSLDGFIATATGDSQFVTGEENILHLHRMRALCDAVVVGAGTVAADDPRLTTRLVPGRNPVRVVLDPAGRLEPHHRVFCDGEARTLRVCIAGGAPRSRAAGEMLTVASRGGRIDLEDLLGKLRARGFGRIFVEGGGITVSAFLEAGLLDRLQVAVAPLIVGAGRPAIRIPSSEVLRECLRPRQRVFRMGADILFDCELAGGESAARAGESPAAAALQRIV